MDVSQKSAKPYHKDIIFVTLSYLLGIISQAVQGSTLCCFVLDGYSYLSFTCSGKLFTVKW